MSKVIDVSQKLGQYMLNGWVLTDLPCQNTGCRVPLMRSPQGREPVTHFCPNCDDDPETPSTSTESQRSNVSTPLTEVSNSPELPALTPVLNPDEILRRREQSDRASQEIGNRLLQGWTMLADDCPSPSCYGVPLVRPPKSGTEKDPRKECVICRTVYTSESDWAGRQRLVPETDNDVPISHAEMPPEASVDVVSSQPRPVQNDRRLIEKYDASDTLRALGHSSKSLQSALHTLSTRLASFTGTSTMDPSSIGSTAEAISKVTQALAQVKQLEWSERQAGLQWPSE